MANIHCDITRWYLDIDPLSSDVESLSQLRAHGRTDRGHACEFSFFMASQSVEWLDDQIRTLEAIGKSAPYGNQLKKLMVHFNNLKEPRGFFQSHERTAQYESFYSFALPISPSVKNLITLRQTFRHISTSLWITIDSFFEEANANHSYTLIDSWQMWQAIECLSDEKAN